jgi:hypothetical protein
VTFTVRLQMAKNGTFQFLLDHPVLGPSTRFTRCFGSAWLIRLKLPKEIFSRPGFSEKLRVLLLRPFVLNGLVFRFFYCNKDHNAYLMATNEIYDGGLKLLTSPLGGPARNSFLEFFSNHNNPQNNRHQVSFVIFNEVNIMFTMLRDDGEVGIKDFPRFIKFHSRVTARDRSDQGRG